MRFNYSMQYRNYKDGPMDSGVPIREDVSKRSLPDLMTLLVRMFGCIAASFLIEPMAGTSC